MSIAEQVEVAENWAAASEELARRADEYGLLAELSKDELDGYRWAKRALRAVKASSRCMDRCEAAIAALASRTGGAA